MPDLTKIDGVGPSLATALVKGNFLTIAQIAAADPTELATVPGISRQGAARIVAAASSLGPKPRARQGGQKRSRGAVAPPKAAPVSRSKAKIVEEKIAIEAKNMKQQEKIKKLKKKIRKLKRQKKKILARDKKRS